MKKETKEKTSVPVFPKKKKLTTRKRENAIVNLTHSDWEQVVNPVQRNVRSIRRIHSNLSVFTHRQSLICMWPPSSLTREIRAKLISCSTLTEKKDSFDVFLQATPPRPPTLQPSLCYSNLSGELFQLLVHLQPLLFFVWLEQILANHYQFSSMNGSP